MAGARVALTLWQARGRRGSLPALLDEVFDQLTTGLAEPARRQVGPPADLVQPARRESGSPPRPAIRGGIDMQLSV